MTNISDSRLVTLSVWSSRNPTYTKAEAADMLSEAICYRVGGVVERKAKRLLVNEKIFNLYLTITRAPRIYKQRWPDHRED